MAERNEEQQGLDRSGDRAVSGPAAQTWAHFLKELRARGGLGRELAERAASSVMCALEQRIVGGEVDDLEAQLPSRLRELLQRCPSHAGNPPRRFGRDEFIGMIAKDLDVEPEEAEHLARVVFQTVRERLSDGEVDDVSNQLPRDLEDLWRAAV